MDPQQRFAALVQSASGEPGVQPPDSAGGRRFGSETLRLGGSIVAMLVQGRVVLKLPRQRVEELLAEGVGAPFENGAGRPMREWVALTGDPDCCERHWTSPARELSRGSAGRSPGTG